jgi:hypothetical protein
MEIYIQKNGQQMGPFDQAQVAAMLKSRELSQQDLAIMGDTIAPQDLPLYARQQWQTIESLLPHLIGIDAAALRDRSVEKKKPNLLPGLVAAFGILLTIGIVGSFFAMQHSRQQREAKIATDSLAAAENATKAQASYKAFKDKAMAITQLQPDLKLNKDAKVKGKLLIFIRTREDSPYDMIGFDHRSKNSDPQSLSLDESDIKEYSLKLKDLAENLDEVETVVKIDCGKGEAIARYDNGLEGYSNRCLVSMIDYKMKTIFAQKTFENVTPEERIPDLKYQSEVVVIYPFAEVSDYVTKFPRG